MRSLNILILSLLAATLAAGNLWYSAARSTIPLALDGRVTGLETRLEKHPPKDDVHLLTLESDQTLHVDPPVAAAITVGSELHKPAWSRTLQVDSQPLVLNWSVDFRGLIIVMPLTLLVMLATAVGLAFPPANRDNTTTADVPPAAADR